MNGLLVVISAYARQIYREFMGNRSLTDPNRRDHLFECVFPEEN